MTLLKNALCFACNDTICCGSLWMASRLQLLVKGEWFLTLPIHMNHTKRVMTALTQSCSFLHHVLLEVRLKLCNLTSSASNITFSGEVGNT